MRTCSDKGSGCAHQDDDGSPYAFVMWMPIEKTTGKLIDSNIQVIGGEFVFPIVGCGIQFEGFNGVVECAWKAKSFLKKFRRER